MGRDIAFIFTGLLHKCAEFDLLEHSIKQELYNRFDNFCFPVTIELVKGFESGGKAEMLGTMEKEISDRGDPFVLLLAHSYGCILAIQMAQKLFESGKTKVALILIDPTSSSGILSKFPTEFTTLFESTLSSTDTNFAYPTLILTFLNIDEILNKIKVLNKLKKLQNAADVIQLKKTLQNTNYKIDNFQKLLGQNKNINIHILPVLPEDVPRHSHNPHFIHLNEPDRVLKEITNFIGLLSPTVGGSRRKTRRQRRKQSCSRKMRRA